MSRLQRKCFFASAVLHSVLLGVLLVGPAFVTTRTPPPPADTPILYLIPANARMTDGATRGGGNPNARPPAPAPTPEPRRDPTPPVQPAVQPTPEPQRRVVEPAPKPVEPKPEPRTPAPKLPARDLTPAPATPNSTKPAIKVAPSLTKRTTPAPESTSRKPQTTRAPQPDRFASAANKIAERFDRATRDLGQNLSSGTEIDIPGPGGAAFVNYRQYVQTAYYNAWLPPDSVESNARSVLAEVVVGRTGKIVSQRIVESSRIPALDRSVDDALDRVRLRGLPAFPEETDDLQRTFKIRFNLQTKRMYG